MEKLKQKLLAVILAVAMVISGITVPEKTAKAATSSQKVEVYFKYTGTDSAWGIVGVNQADSMTVTNVDGTTADTVNVNKLKKDIPKMQKNDDGWYCIKVSADKVDKIEFVYPKNASTYAKSSYEVARDMIYVSSATDKIYYVYDGSDLIAYNDEECTDKVYPLGNIYRVHFINSGNWDDVVMTYTGKQDNASSTPNADTATLSNSDHNSGKEVKEDDNGYHSFYFKPADERANYSLVLKSVKAGVTCTISDDILNFDSNEFWIQPVGSSGKYKIYYPPEDISLPESYDVPIGNESNPPAVTTTTDNGFTGVKWSVDDETVAKVDSKTGIITGLKVGTTTLRAVSQTEYDDEVYAETTLNVTPVMVSKIIISAPVSSLKIGQEMKISATVTPDDAENKELEWVSSNSNLKISDDGVVSADTTCDSTVYTRAKDGSGVESNKIVIKVQGTYTKTVKVDEVKFEKTTMSMYTGEEQTIEAAVLPANADYTNLEYHSSDERVVSVNGNKITALRPGNAKITVTLDNKSDNCVLGTCDITVDNAFILRGDGLDDGTGTNYTFKYTDENTMEMISKLKLKKGLHTYTCETDDGRKVANGREYTIYVNNATEATVTVTFNNTPEDESAVMSFKGTNDEDITTQIPEVRERYTVVGDVLNGWNWDGFDSDMHMVKNETTGLYEYTWTGLEAGKKYLFKIAKDAERFGSYYEIGSGNADEGDYFTVTTEYASSLYITYNPETNEVKYRLKVSVGGISCTFAGIQIETGEVREISYSIYPKTAENTNVKFESDDTSVVTVDEAGVVVGINPGTANVTLTTEDGGFKDVCEVLVVKAAVSRVSLGATSKNISVGESATLTAKILPQNAYNKNCTWTSDDENVVTVNDGVITGISAGSAKVTVTTEDGNKSASCNVVVSDVAVSGISISQSEIYMIEGNTQSLTAAVVPANATDKRITWSSDDKNIATVNDGIVKATGQGTTKIRAVSADGGYEAVCVVNVSAKIEAITGIEISKSELTMDVGDTYLLTYKVRPEDANNLTEEVWESEDTEVATVDGGKVKAVGPGTTYVSVKVNGKFTAKCKISVNTPVINVTDVVLSVASLTLSEGSSRKISAQIVPVNATDKTVIWSSDNEKVATVEDGMITAISKGEAKITVKTRDGKKTDTMTVIVEENTKPTTTTEPEETTTRKPTTEPEETTEDKTTEPTGPTKDNTTETTEPTEDKTTEPTESTKDNTTEPEETTTDKPTTKPTEDKTTTPTEQTKDNTTGPEETTTDRETTISSEDKTTEPEETTTDKASTAPTEDKTTATPTTDKPTVTPTEEPTTSKPVTNKVKVTYIANGGKAGAKSKTVTYKKAYGKLTTAKRKGYTFKGWYTKRSGGSKVTSKTKVKKKGMIKLYAHWQKVKVSKVSKITVKASKKKVTLKLKKVTGAKGYEITYSLNKNFKSKKKITTTKTTVNINKLKSGKKYYIKVRAYKTDSAKSKVYSSYSKVKSIKVK
ncbi:MAG: Ig-like domain-containing protein [Lachnospiraceae bacterium]|nr:Ig-like domain-containing protein [Lachnospiraceae bacterium]